ncbi:hypothetical protein VNO80_21309 [Phaseolus coccineus]|uniref:Uncharacterized protein n=1 Tax=Phaseolus coccineus TaxID=3886 RepID=A0AAN9M2U4_PHACN
MEWVCGGNYGSEANKWEGHSYCCCGCKWLWKGRSSLVMACDGGGGGSTRTVPLPSVQRPCRLRPLL